MDIKLIRYRFTDEQTHGIMLLDNTFQCYTVEDKVRMQKIHGQTAIPEGCYDLKQRKEMSGLTEKYRNKFDWFDWHWQLQNVPNFNWVYIHIGNTHLDSEGCLLVGTEAMEDRVGKSTAAFEKLYHKLKQEEIHQIEIMSI